MRTLSTSLVFCLLAAIARSEDPLDVAHTRKIPLAMTKDPSLRAERIELVNPDHGWDLAACSKDARTIALATSGGVFRLSDTVSNATLATFLESEGASITTLALSPGGERVAWGCRDGNVGVCLVNGRERKVWQAHEKETCRIAFSSETEVVTASTPGEIGKWNIDGTALWKNDRRKEPVTALDVRPGVKYCAIGDMRGVVRLLSMESGEEVRTHGPMQSLVAAVSISPDGKSLAMQDSADHLVEWFLATDKGRAIPWGMSGGGFGIAWARAPNTLVVCSDRAVGLCNETTGAWVGSCESTENTSVRFAAVASDGERFLTLDNSGFPSLWQISTRTEPRNPWPGETATFLTTSQDGQWLIACGAEAIHSYDLEGGQAGIETAVHPTLRVQGSPRARLLRSGWSRTVFGRNDWEEWDPEIADQKEYGKAMTEWRANNEEWKRAAVDVTPDGRVLARISETKLSLVDIGIGHPVDVVGTLQNGDSLVAISPDATRVAALDGKYLRVWSRKKLDDRFCCQPDQRFTQEPRLHWSADSRVLFLVSNHWDRGLSVLFLPGASPCVVENDTRATAIAWSPDGRLCVEPSPLRVVEAASGQTLFKCATAEASTCSAAFSADGRSLFYVDDRSRGYEMRFEEEVVLAGQPAEEEISRLWESLGSGDAAEAWATIQRLGRQHGCVDLLHPHVLDFEDLEPPLAGKELEAWQLTRVGLNSEVAEDRVGAVEAIQKLDARFEVRLAELLAHSKVAEIAAVERELSRIQLSLVTWSPMLRHLRSHRVLERIATKRARNLLFDVSMQSPSPMLRADAAESVQRLDSRERK